MARPPIHATNADPFGHWATEQALDDDSLGNSFAAKVSPGGTDLPLELSEEIV